MSTKTTITKRIEPCNCGCQGADPWHQKSYDRVLRNVVEASGTVRTVIGEQTFSKTAEVRVPWSEEPVTVYHLTKTFAEDGKTYSYGWYFSK